MHRCLELAGYGSGFVSPNPMVGAVLVHNGRIIGEGYHRQYGQAHAEVNCIDSVPETDRKLISESTLYVSLEPCAHFGKTPPCSDLIIGHKIPKCIIGCRDPFKEVDGKGIEKLQAAGVHVEVGVLEKECKDLNKRFFTFHTQHRPYIILKWAQTGDGFIATSPQTPVQGRGTFEDSYDKKPVQERLLISNEYSNRLVHKWRSEETSILVGTNTALLDDPELTTRLWTGPSPVRMVLDMNLRLPSSLKMLNDTARTIIFNSIKQEEKANLLYYQLNTRDNVVRQIADALCKLNIQSVLVEGGAELLQSFIDENLWDEARVITNTQLTIAINQAESGLRAPILRGFIKESEMNLIHDRIKILKPSAT